MKTVTVYGCCMGPQCGNATALLLEPWPSPQTISINGSPEFQCDTTFRGMSVFPTMPNSSPIQSGYFRFNSAAAHIPQIRFLLWPISN